MRKAYYSVAVPLVLLLAGCGGDDQSASSPGPVATVTPTPTPTPSPTPSPTPTPTPTPAPVLTNSDIVTLQADQIFDTVTAVLQYTEVGYLVGGGPALTIDALSAPAIDPVFSYAVSPQAYTYQIRNSLYLPDDPNPSFGPSERVTSLSSASISDFQRQGPFGGMNPGGYELMLFNAGPTNDRLVLTYASMGLLTISQAVSNKHEVRAFGYCLSTPIASVPTSGTVSFSGLVMGRGASTNLGATAQVKRQYNLSGTLQLNVNYTARSFTGTLLLNATDVDPNKPALVPIGTYPVTGSLDAGANSVTGTINDGSFKGLLAGPSATEAVGTFAFTIPDPTVSGLQLTVVGVAATKR